MARFIQASPNYRIAYESADPDLRARADRGELGTGEFDEAPGVPASEPEVRRYTQSPSDFLAERRAMTTVTPAEQERIRQETYSRFQPQLDAIEAIYASAFAREAQAGAERAGRTRAIGARGGLLGSPRGQAQQEKTAAYNREIEGSIRAQKQAEIASVFGNIDRRATEALAARKAELEGDYGAYEKFKIASRAEARADVQNAAKIENARLEDMAPEDINDLIEQGGYRSRYWLEQDFNASKPPKEKIDYQYQYDKETGTITAYGIDPTTGEIKRLTSEGGIERPEGAGWKLGTINGQSAWVNELTRETEPIEGYEKPVDELEREEKRLRIAKLRKEIEEGDGDDILSIKDAEALGVPYGTTKAQAIAQEKVPGAKEEAGVIKQQALTSAKGLLDKFEKGKGKTAVGFSKIFGLQLIPGTPGANFKVQFNNLKSLLSLDNVKFLKGQGQVSDAERRLLSEAAARLELSQSEGEFKSALEDIVEALSGGGDEEIDPTTAPIGTTFELDGVTYRKVGDDEFEEI